MTIVATIPRPPALTSFLQDVVGVYDSGFIQLFPQARPIRAFVKEESNLMIQPLETGAEIISHRIIIPTEIDMPVQLQVNDFFNTYQKLKQIWNAGDLITVQTKVDTYSNQVLYSVSHDENTDMQNTITMFLRFRIAQFAPVPQYAVTPQNPSYGDSVPLGQQQGVPVVPSRNQSGLYNIFF
jgi:hypothetical protein